MKKFLVLLFCLTLSVNNSYAGFGNFFDKIADRAADSLSNNISEEIDENIDESFEEDAALDMDLNEFLKDFNAAQTIEMPCSQVKEYHKLGDYNNQWKVIDEGKTFLYMKSKEEESTYLKITYESLSSNKCKLIFKPTMANQ